MKTLHFALLTTFACFFQKAMADESQRSPGENGANRRVISPSHYGTVAGIFSEPTIGNIQREMKLRDDPTKPVPCSKTIPTLSTAADDVPQVYVGYNAPIAIDAGVTWQSYAVANVGRKWVTGEHGPAVGGNWRPFFRILGGCYRRLATRFTYPRGNHWRLRVALSIVNDTIGYAVFDAASGNLVAAGYCNIFNDPDDSITYVSGSQLSVKRVVAMTQTGSPDYDGSYLLNAKFEGGVVRRVVDSPSTPFWKYSNDGPPVPWSSVGGQHSHFFPAGRYRNATDKQKVGFVIETLPPRNTSGFQPNPDNKLFDTEVVSIRMIALPKSKGRSAQHH